MVKALLGRKADVNVRLSITHTWDDDLLIRPGALRGFHFRARADDPVEAGFTRERREPLDLAGRLAADAGRPCFLCGPHARSGVDADLQLGLRMARHILARRGAANKLIFIITDGQPTAHVESAGLKLSSRLLAVAYHVDMETH